MPKFSIIAVDYEHHVPRPGMKQGLHSLATQTFKDFELIIVHDGKKNIPYEEEFDFSVLQNPPIFLNTPERMNNWGHSGRDLGMRNATGEYFLHFNIDNLLYANCLEKISNKIDESQLQIIIYSIIHYKAAGADFKFTGLPPVHCMIDAMQLVAHRDIWKEMNYWYNTETTSDGIIYEEMCKRYPYVHIDEVLAENY